MAKSNTGRNDTTVKKTSSDSKLKEMELLFKEAEKKVKIEKPLFEGPDEVFLPLQNPEASYDKYYKVLFRFKKKYIPAKEVGQPIRDEINKILKEGREFGRDGRMAYTSLMDEAILICRKWIEDHQGANLMELFYTLRDFNNQKSADKEKLHLESTIISKKPKSSVKKKKPSKTKEAS